MRYLEQYKQFLEVLQKVEGVSFDATYEDGDFKDSKVGFGYIIFHLEKARVDRMWGQVAEEFDRQFESMYQLGKEAGIQEALKGSLNDF